VIFSDGCSSQYKYKGPFAELAHSKSVINRNYFGSEKDKSECDAEIGVLNRCFGIKHMHDISSTHLKD